MREFLELMENWNGFVSIKDTQKPENWEQRVTETVNLFANTNRLPLHKREFLLREAMTTSDFPLLMADVLQRQVLASYKAVEPVWKAFTRQGTAPRVYPLVGGYRYAITGGSQFLNAVGEKEPYPLRKKTEDRYAIYVFKFGASFDISWEALINDDLGALKGTPQEFAMAAVRTEMRAVTATYAGDVGVHAAHANLYEVGVNCSALPLTIPNLQAARATMRKTRDVNGEPILNKPKVLVVPPDLEDTGREILTSTMKIQTDTGTPWPMTNVVPQYGLQLIVDDYLPVIDQVSGTTAWYLFSDPADIAAMEFDHLTGHETPEICMKASNKVTIGGGGDLGPLSGDFDNDDILYRVRTTFGGAKLDWRATYMGGYAGGS